jgi:RNA polymerase sigma-70 factor (ECF subfamily)
MERQRVDERGPEGGTNDERSRSDLLALHRHLVRIVTGITGDACLAEDASQEALARLWEKERSGAIPENREAWATRAAINWATSGLRRRGAERRALKRLEAGIDRPGATTGRAPGELSTDVRRLLLTLPRRQREVVVLHYLADHDVATIARIVGITQGAVKNALFNGRKNLAARIAPTDHQRDGHAVPDHARPTEEDAR